MSSPSTFLLCLVIAAVYFDSSHSTADDFVYHEYIIIGGGPAGIQMGYLMEQFDAHSTHDYLIVERSYVSGSWFQKYPRPLNSFPAPGHS